MQFTFRPEEVANFFIQKGIDNDKPLTPMQVIKLTYISHGWNLAITEHPLFDEQVEAWKYGPVVESIYHDLKNYINKSIDQPIKCCDKPPTIPQDNKFSNKLLSMVWERYKSYSGTQLSGLTHKPGTPWWRTVEPYISGGFLPRGLKIDNNLIKQYYKELLKN